MKKFLTYQLDLYGTNNNWKEELKSWINYRANLHEAINSMIDDALDELLCSDFHQPNLTQYTITNNYNNSTIGQINTNTNNSTNNMNINSPKEIFDEMFDSGVPKEIIEEGKEILEDADKSDSLKKIAGNWIKNLPFKLIEKAPKWVTDNVSKLEEYQNKLGVWLNQIEL